MSRQRYIEISFPAEVPIGKRARPTTGAEVVGDVTKDGKRTLFLKMPERKAAKPKDEAD